MRDDTLTLNDGLSTFMKPSGARLGLLTYLCISFILVGAGIVLPAWVAFHYGGTGLVGLVLIFTNGSTIALAPIAGHIVDKHDKRAIATAGQALRAIGFMGLALPELLPHGIASSVILIASGAIGGFGFSLQMGAISALTQMTVAANDRARVSFQISLAKQTGISAGTGLAGLSIDKFGSSTTAMLLAVLALVAVSCLSFMRLSALRPSGTANTIGFFGASWRALTYLRQDAGALTATIAVGLAFSIIQTTNLLLPGFVVHELEGSTSLFGLLEMIAAIAGFAAVAVSAHQSLADKLRAAVIPLLVTAGLSLMLFSFTNQRMIAVAIYALAGTLWSLSRAAADAALLAFVETAFIGRVQALTTLVTAVVGLIVYSLPTIFAAFSEAQLYALCGGVIAAVAAGLYPFAASHCPSSSSEEEVREEDEPKGPKQIPGHPEH
ncbi:MFS transporter [Bradyrhizobium sp. CCGE-LA001]|uniref:MFS transporter n=1 Tax=Bradyrhizobium sp. CCGE-LA001 TaxID=1223566 RepID=UPI0013149165|nr:MFS transporter [Bradyrhizobium sp. CCGE-LA001]